MADLQVKSSEIKSVTSYELKPVITYTSEDLEQTLTINGKSLGITLKEFVEYLSPKEKTDENGVVIG